MADPESSVPLHSLVLFEAAARHLNFTQVAEEFGTSQPAVSQRIAALEKDLGVALFTRARRGVALTPDGAALHDGVRDHLAAIALAVGKVRQRGARQVLTVATDFAFAHFWLMPRLAQFQQLHPACDVRVVTSQAPFDIRGEAVDLAIWFGDGQWAGCAARQLLPEMVVPVCSPGLAQTSTLAQMPLLHLESQGTTPWMTWAGWMRLQGQPARAARPGPGFANYPLLIQAAIAGQGVALGWRPLVDDLLRDGQLAALPVPALQTACGYYLVHAIDRAAPAARDSLADWVARQAQL